MVKRIGPLNGSGNGAGWSSFTMPIANDPLLILGDEPTGNLDTKNGENIANLLVSLAVDYGKTVVLATHDPRVATKVHVTHTMVDGRLDWTGK